MKRIPGLILFLIIILMHACVTPQGDYEENVDYGGDVFSYFQLSIVNVDGSNLRELTDLPKEYLSGDLVFFIDNDQKLLVLDPAHLTIVDADSLKILNSIEWGFDRIRDAEISMNGRALVVSASDSSNYTDLYLVDLSNFDIQNITNSPALYERYPSFSHDGTKIVFTSFPEWSNQVADQTISIYDINTQQTAVILTKANRTDLLHTLEFFYYPKFTASDTALYFLSHQLNNGIFNTLMRYSLENHQKTPLFYDISNYHPFLLTDNFEYAFFCSKDYPVKLISFNLITLQANDVAELDVHYDDYALSKDGSKFAYLVVTKKDTINGKRCNRYDHLDLWVANVDGTEKKMIASGRWPVFSNDGKKIAFYQAHYYPEY